MRREKKGTFDKCLFYVVHSKALDIADRPLQLLELFLDSGVLLRHLLVLGLPLLACGLESLHFTFEVSGLDVRLAQPTQDQSVNSPVHKEQIRRRQAYFSLVSLRVLSVCSASSSISCIRRCRASFCELS